MKTKENCRALVLGAAVVGLFFQGFAGWSTEKSERPRPSAALRERLASDADVIGIVHWGLNTYTDREWGFGDEDPAKLDPKAFDADQIVGACAAGGLKGLVIVAKHHEGPDSDRQAP